MISVLLVSCPLFPCVSVAPEPVTVDAQVLLPTVCHCCFHTVSSLDASSDSLSTRGASPVVGMSSDAAVWTNWRGDCPRHAAERTPAGAVAADPCAAGNGVPSAGGAASSGLLSLCRCFQADAFSENSAEQTWHRQKGAQAAQCVLAGTMCSPQQTGARAEAIQHRHSAPLTATRRLLCSSRLQQSRARQCGAEVSRLSLHLAAARRWGAASSRLAIKSTGVRPARTK